MSLRTFSSLVAVLSLWLVGAVSSGQASEGLPQPTGPVVLEVTGKIRGTNGGEAARFDRHMLEALGTSKLRTSSAWTTGPASFEGVLVSEVLDAVGAEGSVVVATALNDYVVSIPVGDLRRYPIMLALKMEGEYLKIRDKGPIWVVFPRDQHAELRDPLTDKKWIWQLRELHVQ